MLVALILEVRRLLSNVKLFYNLKNVSGRLEFLRGLCVLKMSKAMLKARKEREMRIHEQLYSNLQLLNMVCPPNDGFRKALAKDMFVKNNKAAFQAVVYYLLNALDPELMKVKVPTWPILDSKQEVQFRKEVFGYLNELNTAYPDANIAVVTASHLISPGGYKFAKMMFKLSRLVMLCQLKKRPDPQFPPLHPLKVDKNPDVNKRNIERLKEVTKRIDADTAKLKEEHEKYVADARSKAELMIAEKKEIKRKLSEARRAVAEKDWEKTYADKRAEFENSLRSSSSTLNRCSKLKELASCLLSARFNVNFDENSNTWKEMMAVDSKEIGLVALFQTFKVYLEVILLKKQPPSSSFLNTNLESYSQFRHCVKVIAEDYAKLQKECEDLKTVVENNLVLSNDPGVDDDDDDVQAVPLQDTPTNM